MGIFLAEFNVFMQKQCSFFLDTSGVTAKLPAGTQHSVTGDYNGNGVVANSSAYSLRRHFSAIFMLKFPCDLTVADAASIGDAAENIPDIPAKDTAFRGEAEEGNIRSISGKVIIQPLMSLYYNISGFICRFSANKLFWKMLLDTKPYSA